MNNEGSFLNNLRIFQKYKIFGIFDYFSCSRQFISTNYHIYENQKIIRLEMFTLQNVENF